MEEIIAPSWMACPNDNVGLQIGHPGSVVRGIGLALDATMDTLREAKKENLNFLIVHHPRFYESQTMMVNNSAPRQAITYAIQQDIAIFTAHTNLDAAPYGVNDCLADLIGLPGENRQIVLPTSQEDLFKLVIYAPQDYPVASGAGDLEKALRQALSEVGVGSLGKYGDCTFRVAGIGTFRGNRDSHPALGSPEQLEEVKEWRIETLCTARQLPAAIAAIRQHHPYEEPAIDIVPLRQKQEFGLGRWAELPLAFPLLDLGKKIIQQISSREVRVINFNPQRKVSKIAVWSGGGAPLEQLQRQGIEFLVTGETKNNSQVEIARYSNLAIMLLGHTPSEEVVLPSLSQRLQLLFPWVPLKILKNGSLQQCNWENLAD